MKIIVNADGHKIKLHFPLAVIKTKFVQKMITNKTSSSGDKTASELFSDRKLMKSLYSQLKKYKGLKLVEVRSKDAQVDIII